MLHVMGYTGGGFCFMINDKAVSVQEALIANGKPFTKHVVDSLNRNNLANESDLANFEYLAKVLYTGLSPTSAVQLLQKRGVRLSVKYDDLRHFECEELLNVYQIAKYNAPRHATTTGEDLRYFFKYLQKQMKIVIK